MPADKFKKILDVCQPVTPNNLYSSALFGLDADTVIVPSFNPQSVGSVPVILDTFGATGAVSVTSG